MGFNITASSAAFLASVVVSLENIPAPGLVLLTSFTATVNSTLPVRVEITNELFSPFGYLFFLQASTTLASSVFESLSLNDFYRSTFADAIPCRSIEPIISCIVNYCPSAKHFAGKIKSSH